ncbi:MAG: hypothetical protein LN414_01320 [Candidatus Thermoplasmatota archaeon]|nr:hypothetical protein [Candidatus Thermoplasmatota archaeon]
MWLRSDTRGEVGVFEDLQTLLVVVVGVGILLGSSLYNWSAISSAEEDQDLYDEAEHIVKQIEANEQLMAVDSNGDRYNDFYLKQTEVYRLLNETIAKRTIRSDYNFQIVFDDQNQDENISFVGNFPEDNANEYHWNDTYVIGEPVPEGKEKVVLRVQYVMVMDIQGALYEWDVSVRHACLLTVEVWR